jgi:hypothetical protein
MKLILVLLSLIFSVISRRSLRKRTKQAQATQCDVACKHLMKKQLGCQNATVFNIHRAANTNVECICKDVELMGVLFQSKGVFYDDAYSQNLDQCTENPAKIKKNK